MDLQRLGGDQGLEALRAGRSHDPHAVLGAHRVETEAQHGAVVRAFHPDALGVDLMLPEGPSLPMSSIGGGVYVAFVPDVAVPLSYRLRFHFEGNATWERDDPYRFLPTLGDIDLHLIGEGTHRRLWRVLGSQPRSIDGTEGTAFAVWAPSASSVSLVGDFNRWDGRLFPMRSLGSSGVWELFVPGVGPGALYKYEIRTREGSLRTKCDPWGREMEHPPATATRVTRSEHEWGDASWMSERTKKDHTREPISIYEVHLGSFLRVPEEDNRWLGYRELAPILFAHVKKLGFTHLELMHVAEHANYPSRGYQLTCY
jgi:1,4-alpha-glucan branching enzyme